MMRSRPGRSVTSSRPSGSGSTDHGWSSDFVSSTTSNATLDVTPQMRVWPGNAGVCPLAFGARVSSGVQLAGSATGAAVAAVVPATAVLLVLLPLDVLVPGLAQPARAHATSAAFATQLPGRENAGIISAVVKVSVNESGCHD